MKIINTIFIFCFIWISSAQTNVHINNLDFRKNRYYNTNVNGPVESTKIASYIINNKKPFEGLSFSNIVLNERNITGSVYIKFYRDGNLYQKSGNIYPDKDVEKWIKTNSTTYIYQNNKSDNLHAQCNLGDSNFPVYKFYAQKKPDYMRMDINKFFEGNSLDAYKQDSLHKSYEKYLYTLKDNRITEEKNFSLLMAFNQNADPDNLASYIHYQTIEFVYDNTGKLVAQKVKLGNGPGLENSMFNAERWAIPFHAMGTESGFCEDLHLSYQYDAKDRITDIVFFGCNDTLAKEHYTYDEKAGYVNKIRKYTGGIGGPVSVPKTVDLFYDEHANVIKREFIQPSHHTFSFNDIPQTTYYKYDYDKYNNWIKCYIYYTGKPEGEPTAVVERKIEYYEE